MNATNRLLVSILGGELLTLLTGLIQSTPPMLVGAEHYGFPFAWLFRLVIAPQYNPWRMDLLSFFADIVVWSVIAFVIIFVLEKARKPASK